MAQGHRAGCHWAEIGSLEYDVLSALCELHLPFAERSPDGKEDWRSFSSAEVFEHLAARGGFTCKVGGALRNLERKGFVRSEKQRYRRSRGLLGWQITVAGCGALMRARAEGDR